MRLPAVTAPYPEPDKDRVKEELFSVGLGVQGLMASLGLGVKPPTIAADVGDRAEAEVSPENFSETRVTAVTGWWGSRKERLTGRGLGDSWADEAWTSEDPLAEPASSWCPFSMMHEFEVRLASRSLTSSCSMLGLRPDSENVA